MIGRGVGERLRKIRLRELCRPVGTSLPVGSRRRATHPLGLSERPNRGQAGWGVFPRTRLGESRCDVVAAGRGSFAPAPPNGVHAQPPADTPLYPRAAALNRPWRSGPAGPDGGHPEPVGHAGGGRLPKSVGRLEHL